MVRALPGDPTETLIAESGTSIPRDELRREMGLDRPFFQALFDDSVQFLHGDFGKSLISKRPIAKIIVPRFANTVRLSSVGVLLALCFSLLIGVTAAAEPGGFADRFCTGFSALTSALPTPWIGPVLIVVLSLWLPVFRLDGSIALPAITLALAVCGFWSRLIRSRVRDCLIEGPARAARGRGISEWKIRIKYGLAPVSGVLLGYFGTQIGALFAGTIVVEVIFNWRGMGTLWVDAVLRRDYPVIEVASFIGAATTLLGILFGDWARSRFVKAEEKIR